MILVCLLILHVLASMNLPIKLFSLPQIPSFVQNNLADFGDRVACMLGHI